ncbi:MAG: CHC2 zinc finger domain-containing protein [Candidatus Aerophobetes bacterium]|nr:CHC2 zinc finger domain-containing protein [Candidatus Aerophobetes bacterium]
MNKKFKLWDNTERKVIEVEAKKQGQGKEWRAFCPKHADEKHPNLDINEEKRVYLCRACGWKGHLYNSNYRQNIVRKEIVAVYDYKDEKGKLLFQVVRYYPKTFKQRRPNGKDGWIWDLKGVRRVLYHLPELIKSPDPVIIVEGEKDTNNLWKLGFTATTSPMGAGKWKKEYNKFLEGREVILNPDNHKEGWEHGEQIGLSLFGEAKKIKWLDLPGLKEKEDVSDWIARGGTKEELLKLIKQAPEFNPERKVYQLAGSYIKRGKGAITNFVITPKVRVQTDEGEFLKASISTHTNKTYQDVQFNPDSWISKNRFKKALKGLLDLEYRGTDDDIQDIKGILASQEPPIKKGVKTTGLHKVNGEWLYIEEGLAWDKKGERQDIVYLSDNPYRVRLLKEANLTSNQLDKILSYLFNFNSEDVVYPLLGYCFACFIKERIISLTGQNPILVCWGEKNSGKTETLRQVIKPLFGIRSSIENIGHPTEFGFARIISSSNLAPILFDEHKTGRISETQRNKISEMLRAVYNQTRFTRGTPSLGIVEFIYSAPIIVAGEMGISELAIKDRIVEIYFSKKKIEGRKEIFDKLIHLSLSSLGKDFLLWTLKLNDKEIKGVCQIQLENIDNELDLRLRQNTAHARVGLALFLRYLSEKGKDIKRFEEGFDVIDQTQKKNILEESNKTIIDTIIEAFSVMVEQNNILEEGKHYKVDSNMNLNLHISSIYPLFKKWAKDYQWDGEVLDKNSFLRQIKEAKYFIKNTNIRFEDKLKWGVCLDLSKMDHLEIGNFRG